MSYKKKKKEGRWEGEGGEESIPKIFSFKTRFYALDKGGNGKAGVVFPQLSFGGRVAKPENPRGEENLLVKNKLFSLGKRGREKVQVSFQRRKGGGGEKPAKQDTMIKNMNFPSLSDNKKKKGKGGVTGGEEISKNKPKRTPPNARGNLPKKKELDVGATGIFYIQLTEEEKLKRGGPGRRPVRKICGGGGKRDLGGPRWTAKQQVNCAEQAVKHYVPRKIGLLRGREAHKKKKGGGSQKEEDKSQGQMRTGFSMLKTIFTGECVGGGGPQRR